MCSSLVCDGLKGLSDRINGTTRRARANGSPPTCLTVKGGVFPVQTTTAAQVIQITWSPTTGCDRISAGCDNCYALTLAKRLKAMGNSKYQADGDPLTSGPGFALTEHEDALAIPLGWRSPRTVFVNSMSDLWHAHVSDEFIGRVFNVMRATPQHTYQLLTKRPQRAVRMAGDLPWPQTCGRVCRSSHRRPRGGSTTYAACPLQFGSCPPSRCSKPSRST